MRTIVFDIETTNTFAEAGSSDPAALDLALVGIHDSENDSYSAYMKEDLPQLWKILEKADLLVGYNSDHFDIPLLNKYYPGDLNQIKSIDILVDVHKALGRRIRLDAIAEGTLGMNKSGHGLQSIKWWRDGEYDKVRDYCLKDVEITKKVFDYARKNNALRFKELGVTKEVRLSIAHWNQKKDTALTQTLGF